MLTCKCQRVQFFSHFLFSLGNLQYTLVFMVVENYIIASIFNAFLFPNNLLLILITLSLTLTSNIFMKPDAKM